MLDFIFYSQKLNFIFDFILMKQFSKKIRNIFHFLFQKQKKYYYYFTFTKKYYFKKKKTIKMHFQENKLKSEIENQIEIQN